VDYQVSSKSYQHLRGWLVADPVSTDFRSQDGLYALLNQENDEQTPISAATTTESVNEDTQTRRRSSRTKPVHRKQSGAEHHLADPQEIFDINVFRSHPQVF
jgi:NAD-dependent SIR2 family protein deacetylase